MEGNQKNEFDNILGEREQPEKSFIIQDEEKGFFSKIKDKIGIFVIVILLIICIVSIFSISSAVSNMKDNITDLTKRM